MSRNKNARSDGGASEQAKETSASYSNCPVEKNNTDAGKRKGRIESLLLEGEQNALKGSELKSMTGLSDRDFHLAIQHEREQGILILATDKGYFLPHRTSDGKISEQGHSELKYAYHRIRSMGIGTIRSGKYLRLAIKECEEDQEVTDGRQ